MGAGEYFQFSVQVTKGERISDIASLKVATVDSSLPTLQIVSVGNSVDFSTASKLNPTKTVYLRASIDGGFNIPVGIEVEWSCSSGNFDLTDPSNILTGINTLDLLLNPAALRGGVFYEFAIIVRDKNNINGDSGIASKGFITNSPPKGGRCVSNPAEGTYETIFAIECSGWTDDTEDFPLYYSFSIKERSTGGGNIAFEFGQRQVARKIATQLPAGHKSAGYVQTIQVKIEDSLGSFATFEFPITISVTNETASSVADITTQFVDEDLKAASSTGDKNLFTQAIIKTVGILQSYKDESTVENSTTSYDSTIGAEVRNVLFAFIKNRTDTEAGVNTTIQEKQELALANVRLISLIVDNPDEVSLELQESAASYVLHSAGEIYSLNEPISIDYAYATIASFDEIVFSAILADSTITGTANTQNVNTENVAKRSEEFSNVLSLLTSGQLRSHVPGQKPLEQVTDNLALISARSTTENIGDVPISTSGSSVELPASSVLFQNLSSDDVIDISFYTYTENLYAWSEEEDLSVSAITGMSILQSNSSKDASSATEVPISDLSELIMITIPTNNGSATSVRTCRFWVEDVGWSSEGCFLISQTETHLICGCNHLTEFNVAASDFVPTVNIPSKRFIEDFNLANLSENPLPTMVVFALWTLYLVLLFWANKHDLRMEKKEMAAAINMYSNGDIPQFYIEKPVGSNSSLTKFLIKRNLISKFVAAQVFMKESRRLATSSASGVVRRAHVIKTFVIIFSSAAISALFYGQDQRVAADITIVLVGSMLIFPLKFLGKKLF